MSTSAIRLDIPEALKTLCLGSALIALCTTFGAVWLYMPSHPEFSWMHTYLSEVGGAGGWPAAVFNAGLLIVSPLRFLVAVLLALRLRQLGVQRLCANAIVGIAFVTALGTALMTAAPYNAGPMIHWLGIMLYFLGTVVVQSLIATVESRVRTIPRLLPLLSTAMVLVYVAFAASLVMWQTGIVSRTFPAPIEWACFATSIIWVIGHGIVLGARQREA